MAEAGNFGIMEGLYFTGRKELLEWLNSFLDLEYTKVEQVASAAAFCQLMDALHPGTVALSKVRFNANQEWEFVSNFKLLQKAFDAANIKKHIDVPKLIRAKYQDNLEFLQWFKRYFEGKWDKAEYRAKEKRATAMKIAAGPVRRVSLKPAQPAGQENRVPLATRTNISARRVAVAAAAVVPSPAKPPVKRIAKRRVTMASTRATTPDKPVTPPAAPAKKASPAKRVAASPVVRPASRPAPRPATPKSILRKPVPVAAPVEGDVAAFVETKMDALKDDLFTAVARLQQERTVFSEKLKAIKMICEEDENSAEAIDRILTIIRLGTDEEDQPLPERRQTASEQDGDNEDDDDDGLADLDELEDIAPEQQQEQAEDDVNDDEASEVAEEAGEEDLDFV